LQSVALFIFSHHFSVGNENNLMGRFHHSFRVNSESLVHDQGHGTGFLESAPDEGRFHRSMLRVFCIILTLQIVMITFGAQSTSFTNPVLAGFYPDPAICKAGDDYYLVTSTFAWYPGLPVLHSKDLVNWTTIGHVLDRPGQLNLDDAGVSRGLFAPSIQYHKGIFYVACTNVDSGGNFVVTAKDPKGPWSEPTWLPQVNGIDPSLFFDAGKAFMIYNSDPPENKSLYEGHRSIRMYEFNPVTLKTMGEQTVLVNGGVDISRRPIWIEAPHLYKVGEYYYLMCAEGGTGYDHSEVIFRSRNVKGPFVPGPRNPILTQRHLDPQRENPITTTGHADLVEVRSGEWWAVFLGCRPYSRADDDLYNTGRETFLAPVKWQDGWPVINPDHNEVQYHYRYPLPQKNEKRDVPLSGNFTWKDDFNCGSLALHWIYLRTVREQWLDISDGHLKLKVRPETCSEKGNPSFVGHRQQHIHSRVTASLKFKTSAKNEKAGIVIFQSENAFLYICLSSRSGKPVVQLYKAPVPDAQEMELLAEQLLADDFFSELLFRIESNGGEYSFSYSPKNETWKSLLGKVDGTFLSTRKAGGFVGCVYGLYATSLGKPSSNTALFDWVEYAGNDPSLG
jgi:alpha-N-arabinofuranosidase